ncbi:hypothetical protein D3C71_1384440 [compost metagenome]
MDNLSVLLGLQCRFADDALHFLRPPRRLAGERRDLLKRCRSLFERCGLLLGALGHVVGSGRDIADFRTDLSDGLVYFSHSRIECRNGGIVIRLQRMKIRCQFLMKLCCQIPA